MSRGGGGITLEKGRRCFRRGEDEHAERRGDSGGHDGGQNTESMNGFAYLLMVGEVVCYKVEKLII